MRGPPLLSINHHAIVNKLIKGGMEGEGRYPNQSIIMTVVYQTN
jgi:hypothetical protein